MVRLYYVDEEAYYVARRPNGTPLSVPAWMTSPEAALTEIVPVARLPLRVLLELHGFVVTCISSHVHDVHEEDHDEEATGDTTTRALRGVAGTPHRTAPGGGTRKAETGISAVDAGSGQKAPRGGRR